MFTLKLLVLLASIVLAQSTYGAVDNSSTLIETLYGTVQGKSISSNVRQWAGIPYAAPPIGNLRWKPPVHYSWNNTIDATNYGDSCINTLATEIFFVNVGLVSAPLANETSEDCLYLNIWAPSTNRLANSSTNSTSSGAAVLLWIYGGGFQFGSASTTFDYYNGSNIVENNDDIIVVTFNYRVNMFGFPNAPYLGVGKQNVALLDQRAAVQWVYENIGLFGGDKSRITIFGESAGGASVDYYSYAYEDDPIVAGLIMESGNAQTSTISGALDPTFQKWSTISQRVGCGAYNTSVSDAFVYQNFACMQNVNTTTLFNALNTTAGPSFNPVADNVTVFSDFSDRASKGRFARIPTLVGNNNLEASIFVKPFSQMFGAAATAEEITLIGFTCPSAIVARTRRQYDVPAWRYRYNGVWENLTPYNQTSGTNYSVYLGAYHSSEIPMVFGTYENSPAGLANTPLEGQLSTYIQKAWVAFARDPSSGLNQYGWPTYQSQGTTLITLGNNATSNTSAFVNSTSYDAACAGLFPGFSNYNPLTYP